MAPVTGHIMLSYQWDSQKEVIRIKERLEADGFSIWMDLDEMEGNIYQKMAEGVEGASVVVTCMTHKYENSINCNREIQYSQVKGKKIVPIKLERGYSPSGALGLLVAGALYIDFTDASKFDSNINSLKKEIGGALGKPEPSPVPAKQVTQTAKSSGDHRMRVKWVESRSDAWKDGADKLIASLRAKNIKRGQVISVNAHNNGKEEAAIFAAFYDMNHESDEQLNLAYEYQNNSYGWKTFYETASQQIEGIKAEDVVSLTGCCNTGGRSVFFAFIQYPSFGSDYVVRFVESRSGSWNGAADGVIEKLTRYGAKQGQILSIDAHNNGEDEDAIFSAFWDPYLPSKGDLSIGYKAFNAKYGWTKFYDNIVAECNKMKRKDLISITASINCSDSSVMYLFNYKD